MDTGDLLELAPHYVVMLALALLVLNVVRSVAGELGFWVEFALIGVIVFSYRPIVVRLGYGPSRWQ